MEIPTTCKNWEGLAPQVIISCRIDEHIKTYEGFVVAVCKECKYACIWTKSVWVARIAKEFSQRRATSGSLRRSIREIASPAQIVVDLTLGVRSDLKRFDRDDVAPTCGDKLSERMVMEKIG